MRLTIAESVGTVWGARNQIQTIHMQGNYPSLNILLPLHVFLCLTLCTTWSQARCTGNGFLTWLIESSHISFWFQFSSSASKSVLFFQSWEPTQLSTDDVQELDPSPPSGNIWVSKTQQEETSIEKSSAKTGRFVVTWSRVRGVGKGLEWRKVALKILGFMAVV